MKRSIHDAVGHYLAVRSRSEGEIRAYLKKKAAAHQLTHDQIEELILRYKDLGLINDEHFVEAVVHSAFSKGKGHAFIRQKLMYAGVDKELIKQSLLDPSGEDVALAMEKRLRKYEKKWEGMEKHLKRQKAYMVLLSSGFQAKDISSFIDLWLQKE